MTQLKKNDPRITAYALGELEGAERARFEAELAQDETLGHEVEALRHLSLVLSEELKREPAPELSTEEREKIAPARKRPSVGLRWTVGLGLGLAAAAVTFVVVTPETAERAFRKDGPVAGMSRGERFEERPEASQPSIGALPSTPAPKEDLQIATKQGDMSSGARGGALKLGEATRGKPLAMKPPRFQDMSGAGGMPMDEARLDRPANHGPGKPLGKLASRRSHRPIEEGGTTGVGTGLVASEADDAHDTEAYSRLEDNAFIPVAQDPRSTFSIDVDTASFANVRRFVDGGRLPPKDAVRIEELLNYFHYGYAPPTDGKPFAVHIDVNQAPWNPGHRLVRIGLKGKEVPWEKRPGTNLVFLIDVSGSMNAPNKLPLLLESLRLVVDRLDRRDRVAIVVYAGASGVVLPPTSGADKKTILAALQNLTAGGSTNGAGGIKLAYETAAKHFVKGGINRVVLATDGDFNVGVSSEGELTRLIEEKAKTGVFLSVLGYGMGNYKDAHLEKLADKGNGNYAYIDSLREAKRVLVKELAGTMFTIAKDVKIQLELNPALVGAYRLIGYENRILAHQDFNDDKKDAGDIGSGHSVTALYEIIPKGMPIDAPGVDPLKYQAAPAAVVGPVGNELMTVKLRFKRPDGDKSDLLELPVRDGGASWDKAGPDLRFAAAVASFGMLLRDSKYKGDASWDKVLELAAGATGTDEARAEFLTLVHRAKALTAK